ncbi:MAG: helix-turn-helix domain-containing protein [Oscillospiraceae bacterium]|nr:helix-turn-helix domain-containing protein [Oscillospiraceae bacterium]
MTERKNRYVRLPNELFELGLDHNEIAVYAYLLYCEDQRKNLCYPSYGTIGRTLGMCRNTVRKYVLSLVKKRLIETEETQVVVRGKKRNGNLRYTLLPISEAVDYYMSKQYEAARLEAARQRAEKKLAVFDRTHPV